MTDRIPQSDDDATAASDDPTDQSEELTAYEASKIRREIELEVETFEGRMEG